jgi:GNAT superfamily N-acetyltransferase
MAENLPKGITVRPATSADIPTLGRLGALLVSLYHGFDSDRFIEATPNVELAYAAFLDRELKRPAIIVLVAEGAGSVLGYAYAGLEGNDYMTLRGPAGVLHDLVVDPARRREGIGRLLLDATLAAPISAGKCNPTAPPKRTSTERPNRSRDIRVLVEKRSCESWSGARRSFASKGLNRLALHLPRPAP